jgi:dihydroneopterin aldolase
MSQRIEIQGLRFYAYHGCMEEEARIGQNYQVDVRIETDLGPSAETDDLALTVDYCDVHRIVAQQMQERSRLIEHVAGRIVRALRSELPRIERVEVRVTKFAPPIDGDCEAVAVVLHG